MTPVNGKSRRSQMFLQARRSDKNIFLDALNFFDGFQVWATMPADMVGFVREVGKPFFVDPMSYVFPLPTKQLLNEDETKLKPAVLKLAANYSDLVASTISNRSITSADLIEQLEVLDELVAKSLMYQRTKFDTPEPNLFNSHYDKYDRLAEGGVDVPHETTATTPFTLIPPYFHFHSTDDSWYTTTLRCARMARKFLRPGETSYPVLLMDKSCLKQPSLNRIIKDFGGSNADGFIIWINGLKEEDATPTDIAGLSALISGLSLNGRPVYKLYGGFLSVLLSDSGLDGFSTSVTSKTAYSVRSYGGYGKAAQPKFYIPRLHRNYPIEEAAHIMRAYPFLKCDCLVCQQAYAGNMDRFVSRMVISGCVENHFLNVRKAEMDEAASGSREMFTRIDDTLSRLSADVSDEIKHLRNWQSVFSTATPGMPLVHDIPKAAAAFRAM